MGSGRGDRLETLAGVCGVRAVRERLQQRQFRLRAAEAFRLRVHAVEGIHVFLFWNFFMLRFDY